ncbi:MAG: hypothetical protein ABFD50_04590 [Smithella sp.]
MAKFSIEVDLNDANVIMHAMHQAFIRAEEVCERQFTEGYKPYPPFIESQLKVMKEIHDVSFKIGEQIKKQPYVDAWVVDQFVSIDGTWEQKIESIRDKIKDIKDY